MKLSNYTLYHSKMENISLGSLSTEQLLEFLGNGRQCGVLLEIEIANKFSDCTTGTQGAGADIIREQDDKVQAKTYRSYDYPDCLIRGKDVNKRDQKKIFTTKSGLWDTKKEESERVVIVDEYFSSYDHFMYIDISTFGIDYSYSFIVIPTKDVVNTHNRGYISYNDILSWVKEEKTIQ